MTEKVTHLPCFGTCRQIKEAKLFSRSWSASGKWQNSTPERQGYWRRCKECEIARELKKKKDKKAARNAAYRERKAKASSERYQVTKGKKIASDNLAMTILKCTKWRTCFTSRLCEKCAEQLQLFLTVHESEEEKSLARNIKSISKK